MISYNSTAPSFGILEPDSNDINYLVPLATYTSAVSSCINAIMGSAHPPGKLFVTGMIQQPSNYNTGGPCSGLTQLQCYSAYNQAMYNGVTAASYPATFIPVFGCSGTYASGCLSQSGVNDWLNANIGCTGSQDLNASSHPCPATALGQPGYGKYANRLAPIVAGQVLGHSFTAAASGNTVTVTMPSGVTLFDQITATSSNSGDSICWAGASCISQSAASPVNPGTNTVSFTVTSHSAHTSTISYSGIAAGWVAPSSTSVTVPAKANPGYMIVQ
jgi:hypothetical protein